MALRLVLYLLQACNTHSGWVVCSVGMVHWPETLVVRVIQQACPRDQVLGEVSVAVPGICGRPAVDPKPQVLSWEGQPQYSFKPLWRRKGARTINAQTAAQLFTDMESLKALSVDC